MNLWNLVKESFWKLPFISEKKKDDFYYFIRALVRGQSRGTKSTEAIYQYAKQVLDNQLLNNSFSVDFPKKPVITLTDADVKLIAYYLPQYYPDSHNNAWWGRGSTEWTNTTKAAAQYVGQYQPRLPGELGFYDLRLQENIRRQVELAQFHGIYGFCFYFYWFDGERLLDLPLDRYVSDPKISFPFFLCWVNESWTKQWSSSSEAILMEQRHSVASYKKFIYACLSYFKKSNYIRIQGKPVLNVYRLFTITKWKEVLDYWRTVVYKELGVGLYVIGCITQRREYLMDYTAEGFDAVNEFSLSANTDSLNDITDKKTYVCENFMGKVYDCPEFVNSKKYFKYNGNRLFRAVVTGFDNTARKTNKGIIFDGASPGLYGKWLTDVIVDTQRRKTLDEKLVFIFAWNEWAEGAYLEPDLKFKYGYLEETANAIKRARNILKINHSCPK